MALTVSKMWLSRFALRNQRYITSRLWVIPNHQQCRSYALSRFPTKRATGAGRSRETPSFGNPSVSQRPVNGLPLEDVPSDEDSRMWHVSRRPPASNVGEGLERLLMQNETLIIERYTNSPSCILSIFINRVAGKSRCSISLLVLSNAINTLSVSIF